MENSKSTLFTKYINNECTQAEILSLIQQFELEEDESLLKQEILAQLEGEPVVEMALNADIDSRLNTIKTKLKGYIELDKRHKLRRLRTWIAAAASITVISAAATLYMNQKATPSLQEQVTKSHILPGKNQAILTLANGKKIALTDPAGKTVYAQVDPSEGKQKEPEYNTIETPAGGQWQLILPDGSHVWLNALSSIRYPTTFGKKERRVTLKGEGYFEVTHNRSQPFRVESAGQTVEVLGTKFNVMAYPDEQEAKTTLLEGAVKLVTQADKRNALTLKPGQQGHYRAGTMRLTDHADLEDAVAWKNGYFKFDGNLESIMTKIARWYNVKVVYRTAPDPLYLYEGDISRSRDLNEVLNIIEHSKKVRFTVEEGRIIVQN